MGREVRLARRSLPRNSHAFHATVEAGCYKCHNAELRSSARQPQQRPRLIRIYGCFGCHKIPGYRNVRKVGPDLSTVSGKLTKDWVQKWLANPKEFKVRSADAAVLVQQQQQRRSNGVDWDKRNARKSTPSPNSCGRSPNRRRFRRADRGTQREANSSSKPSVVLDVTPSVRSKKSEPSQIRRRHGYNLANQGSKVSANWIYNWVKDPRSGLAGTQNAQPAPDGSGSGGR